MLAIFMACGVSIFLFNLVKLSRIDLGLFFYEYAGNILIGGCVIGTATWIMELIQRKIFWKKSIDALVVLSNSGFSVEINHIVLNNAAELYRSAFYIINNEVFYNYLPFSSNVNLIKNKIKNLIIRKKAKNIIINLVSSSVDYQKLKIVILDNFESKLDNFLIIDQSGKVIKLK